MPVYVECVFDHHSAMQGQLAFAAGELIEVLQQGEPNDWWEGRLSSSGMVGWFPSAYCSAPCAQRHASAHRRCHMLRGVALGAPPRPRGPRGEARPGPAPALGAPAAKPPAAKPAKPAAKPGAKKPQKPRRTSKPAASSAEFLRNAARSSKPKESS